MDDDGRSMISGFSVQSEGGAYPSFLAPGPLPPVAEGESPGDAPQQEAPKKPRKTKRQLWDDLKISCEPLPWTCYIFQAAPELTHP